MATEFEWKINNLENIPSQSGQENVVCKINWSCSAVENSKAVQAQGTVKLTYAEGDSFIAYDDLTEAKIWEWVYAHIDKSDTEASLQTKLDENLNKPVVSPLPW